MKHLSLSLLAASLVVGGGAIVQAQKSKGPVSAPVTARGIVAGAPGTDRFNLRTDSGVLIVRPHSMAQLKTVRGGDLVRVHGRPSGRTLYGANIRVLQKKASPNAEDYDNPRVERLDGNPDTRTAPTQTPAR